MLGGLVLLCFALLLRGLHGFGEALAAVDAFLGAVHDAAADSRAVIGKLLPPLSVHPAVDLGPIPVQIHGGEDDGFFHIDLPEVHRAVVHLRGYPDDGGLGDGIHLQILGIFADPYVDLRVELKEILHVRIGEDEVFVGAVVGMGHFHGKRLVDGSPVHIDLGLFHHGGTTEKASGGNEAVPGMVLLRDGKDQIVVFAHFAHSFLD